MKKFIIPIIILFSVFFLSANTRYGGNGYEYVVVDTDPGASGFYTRVVVPSSTQENRLSFFVSGTGTMTFTLQYRVTGTNTWVDYGAYADNTRLTIDDVSKNVEWRVGVKSSADYTSGSKNAGFDW